MWGKFVFQGKKLTRFLCLLYFLPLLLLCAVFFASLRLNVPIGMFTRDPAYIADFSPLVGLTSNIGVLLWSASATICLFSWTMLRHRLNKKRFATFLLSSGLITTLLLLDDFFMLHEYIFPHYLGIDEKITLVSYVGLIFFWMIAFKNFILKTKYFILAIAFGFFGLSLFIDVFQNYIQIVLGSWRIFFEDGFKLLGIVGWLGYFIKCCSNAFFN
ncbi:hypothetical protein [Myxosarcina sp. GI1]|uniref:hypothetical protein n=1 Tax=Myxosarcina sp. GI1 TaxID=1541065 RepID=UPI00055BCC3A|nr:hypothetical protein [Myxosarcina sp. GI1]